MSAQGCLCLNAALATPVHDHDNRLSLLLISVVGFLVAGPGCRAFVASEACVRHRSKLCASTLLPHDLILEPQVRVLEPPAVHVADAETRGEWRPRPQRTSSRARDMSPSPSPSPSLSPSSSPRSRNGSPVRALGAPRRSSGHASPSPSPRATSGGHAANLGLGAVTVWGAPTATRNGSLRAGTVPGAGGGAGLRGFPSPSPRGGVGDGGGATEGQRKRPRKEAAASGVPQLLPLPRDMQGRWSTER